MNLENLSHYLRQYVFARSRNVLEPDAASPISSNVHKTSAQLNARLIFIVVGLCLSRQTIWGFECYRPELIIVCDVSGYTRQKKNGINDIVRDCCIFAVIQSI